MTSSEYGYEQDHAVRDAAPASDGRSAEARVHDGLTELGGLSGRPLAEHAPVYEALHDELQTVLAEIDGA